ncbi:hypothetical protein C8Q77DRAFT_1152382 [Trametes polyzona]|nr:hypothetical protein C8Q77DRAFT_1152382 [Trametes polyzona]
MAHPGAGTRAGAEGDPSQRLRLFISGAAQSQRLTAKYQSELHAFQQFLMDLQPDWWRVLVLQQATTYRILDAQERLLQNITELQTTVQRLEAQVAEHFFINKDMADEAVAICRRLILDGRREDYTQSLSNEVIELLKDTAKYPHFADVWKSESQKKQAITMVNNKATDVRKEYRVALVTLTNPLKKSSLSAFIRDLIRKSGWSGEFTPEMALRVAVLRQFVRDHAEELDTLDRDDEGEGDYSRPNKRQKRAVRSRFFLWAEFQHWLKGRIREWGRDIRSGGWAAHIEACLRQERREFPEDELSFIPQAMQTSADAVSPPFPGDDFYEAPNSDLAHLAPLNLTPDRHTLWNTHTGLPPGRRQLTIRASHVAEPVGYSFISLRLDRAFSRVTPHAWVLSSCRSSPASFPGIVCPRHRPRQDCTSSLVTVFAWVLP